MSVAEWDSSLSIGIPKIDLHNQQLFFVLGNLYRDIDVQSEYETAQKLSELLDTYTFHIACEEIWMSRSKSNFTTSHHADHTRIKEILCEMMMSNKNNKEPVSVMISSLVNMLTEHIKKFDVEYAQPTGDHNKIS